MNKIVRFVRTWKTYQPHGPHYGGRVTFCATAEKGTTSALFHGELGNLNHIESAFFRHT